MNDYQNEHLSDFLIAERIRSATTVLAAYLALERTAPRNMCPGETVDAASKYLKDQYHVETELNK